MTTSFATISMPGSPADRNSGNTRPGKMSSLIVAFRKNARMQRPLSLLLALLNTICVVQCASEDLVVADFESADFGAWKTTGEAFGSGPAHGTLPNQMTVDGYLGTGLASSFFGGDASTGTLTSPPFRLGRRYLRFLIGGGGYPAETCLNLRLDGRIVRTAAGPNTEPGGNERLEWQEWDVNEFIGREVYLELVDQRTGGWGHISADQILQTDRPLPMMLTDVTREIPTDTRYLNLPVKNGAPKHWVRLRVDDRLEREFEIELADGDPEWWAFLDLTPFRGKHAVLHVDQLREDSRALASIQTANSIAGGENLYHERLRPQFHFTSRRGWNNDPNGLVFFQGEYHLFYQHNPLGWNWGNMHWGHAVSPDLVHWVELPQALCPDDLGTMFSGSAVVDWRNTAGFASPGRQAMVAIYTAAGGTSPRSQDQPFTQCIAYSIDRGRSWTKYAGNPVLPNIVGGNRDPKVLWYTPGNKWIMALYLEQSDFALFDSADLKSWRRLSTVQLPGTSECPEFFEIPIQHEPKATRWVFYGGDGRYQIGGFDGTNFTPESELLSLNLGDCFYASQTYNDIPVEDGRRILIAWGRVALPGMPFNQMMDFPVELTLRQTDDGLRLFAWPVREIESLWMKDNSWKDLEFSVGNHPLSGPKGDLFDIESEFVLHGGASFDILVRGIAVTYDATTHELSCRDRKATLMPANERIRLRLLVDRASIEIFGNEGRIYLPMGTIPESSAPALVIHVRSGTIGIRRLIVRELRSAWAG